MSILQTWQVTIEIISTFIYHVMYQFYNIQYLAAFILFAPIDGDS